MDGCLGTKQLIPLETTVHLIDLTGNQIVVKLSRGLNFMLMLTNNNTIYCFGQNNMGQLGLNHLNKVEYFIENMWLKDKDIIDIQCGFHHSLALSSNGNVYSWGNNECGQVGGNSKNDYLSTPILLVIPRARAIACGANHSMVLTMNNDIYGWGDNSYGQLGCNIAPFTNAPMCITLNKHFEIKSIVCSDTKSYILNTDNELYYFGQNDPKHFLSTTAYLFDNLHKCQQSYSHISCIYDCNEGHIVIGKSNGLIYRIHGYSVIGIDSEHKFNYTTNQLFFINEFQITQQFVSFNNIDDHNTDFQHLLAQQKVVHLLQHQ
ncbi:X-linked retinitis pigmentosa GTPase regulator-like [Oppia nitens]|uniref:X-linked retinitis pigmentosa GTPase regulator-like n=1 Tax=Oppia nitens TaxID=1686743 RepID=UPI0023DA5E52|nr:X-linked retinitis pigmentosa GTPase regulator-like [Oppia nitens]